MLTAYAECICSAQDLVHSAWRGFVDGWAAPICASFSEARGRCIRSTRRAGRSHGPGRTGQRRGTGSGSCALPAARQGQFGAGRYGACPAAGQPFRGGQNRPTAGAETQFVEPDTGAGSRERVKGTRVRKQQRAQGFTYRETANTPRAGSGASSGRALNRWILGRPIDSHATARSQSVRSDLSLRGRPRPREN